MPASEREPRRAEHGLSGDGLLYALFVAICLGLGYATLARYDASAPSHGGGDARHYHAMVEGREVVHPTASVFATRVLVPSLARALLPLFEGRIGSWSPTALALLIVNSLFVAGTALLVVIVSRRMDGRRDVGLVAALLYLASFAIPNLELAGLVDSAEGFVLLGVVAALLARRWWWLVPLAILGALAKEAVLPLSAVLVATWAWASRAQSEEARPPLVPCVAGGLAGAMAFVLVRLWVLDRWVFPWDVATTLARPSLITDLSRLVDRSALYVFGWLLPLGLPRVRELPREWRLGTVAMSLVATAFALLAHGTVVRLAFDIAAPLLAIAAARLLLEDRARERA